MNETDPPPEGDLERAYRVDAACDRFEAVWLSGKEPRIEEFLDGVEEPERRLLFRELFQLDVDFRDPAESPGVDEWLTRFPEYADEIQGGGSAEQAETDAWHGETQVAQGIGGEPVADSLTPGATFGRYRIIRRLGIGGMGVVFLARQLDVKRPVALKVIRTEALESLDGNLRRAALERFRTEAQAAAQLDHPGIVTVFDVGEIQGRNYLAMRFVDGRSLSEILRDGPLENRRAAQYCRQIAEAVQAAHERGVLHRDLKPQNILIEAASDRALVADFGLAKLLEEAPELTKFGELMGTPQYMAPEQARDAGSVGAAADVYALGATLYHLLTGRPPFQAASAMETVQQLLSDDPLPPRQLNRGVDRDLETICMKCLEKEPERRYISAEELRLDLQRQLDDLPIRARRIGPLGRARRWCRRNPLIAASSAAALLCLLAALMATTIGMVMTAAAKKDTEEGFQDARAALDDMVAAVREEPLFESPELDKLRRKLLNEALTYYQDFLTKRAQDSSLQEEVGETYYRVGLINKQIASSQQALTAFHKATTIQRRLVKRQPRQLRHMAALGTTQNATGQVHADREDWQAANDAFAAAIATREVLAGTADLPTTEKREHQRLLVNSYMNLGIILKRQGRLTESLQRLRTAQELRLELLSVDPADHRLRADLGIGYFNMGSLAIDADDESAAIEHFKAAVENLHQVAEAAESGQVQVEYPLAVCLRSLGDLELEFELAAEHYQEALATLQPLVDREPDARIETEELAQIYMNLGQLKYDEGQNSAAAAAFESAIAILRRLAEFDGTIPNFQRNLGRTWQLLGAVQIDSQQLTEASESLRQSERWLKRLCSESNLSEDHASLAKTQQLIQLIEQQNQP